MIWLPCPKPLYFLRFSRVEEVFAATRPQPLAFDPNNLPVVLKGTFKSGEIEGEVPALLCTDAMTRYGMIVDTLLNSKGPTPPRTSGSGC